MLNGNTVYCLIQRGYKSIFEDKVGAHISKFLTAYILTSKNRINIELIPLTIFTHFIYPTQEPGDV